jgi:hypothetical protein
MLHFIEKSKKEIYNALDNYLIWKAGKNITRYDIRIIKILYKGYKRENKEGT